MMRCLLLVVLLGACGQGVLLHPEAHERRSTEKDAGSLEQQKSPITQHDASTDEGDGDAPAPDDGSGDEAEHDAAMPAEIEPLHDAGNDIDAAPIGPRLDVMVDGPGHIQNAELACDGSAEGCGVNLPIGTTLTLIAAPTGDALFGGWTGVCTGQDESCELTLTEPQRVKATFIPRYSLNIVIVSDISCAGTGNGFVGTSMGGFSCRTSGGVVDTASCSGRLLRGTQVELTAYPQEGTLFQGYSGGCESADRTCTLRVNDDVTVNAMFCGLIH
jgi:hypothetical protein